jgi:hypothetical protein
VETHQNARIFCMPPSSKVKLSRSSKIKAENDQKNYWFIQKEQFLHWNEMRSLYYAKVEEEEEFFKHSKCFESPTKLNLKDLLEYQSRKHYQISSCFQSQINSTRLVNKSTVSREICWKAPGPFAVEHNRVYSGWNA